MIKNKLYNNKAKKKRKDLNKYKIVKKTSKIKMKLKMKIKNKTNKQLIQ